MLATLHRARAWLAGVCLACITTVPIAAQEVALGTGAVLRGLDRLSGQTTDLPVSAKAAVIFAGRLSIEVRECRYPAANPTGDSYAFVSIRDTVTGSALFDGWMVASSPALNAFDHMRYDVWVLRCTRD